MKYHRMQIFGPANIALYPPYALISYPIEGWNRIFEDGFIIVLAPVGDNFAASKPFFVRNRLREFFVATIGDAMKSVFKAGN